MGGNRKFFIKNQQGRVGSSCHCRRARRFSRQIAYDLRRLLRGVQDAAFASRIARAATRASRETEGADFVARKPMG